MANWQDTLAPFNTTLDNQGDFCFPEQGATSTLHPLTDRGLLEVKGPDSKKFLQGQVTCNMDDISLEQWALGAICDPKGRMITSFNLYPVTEDRLLLEMDRPLVQATIDAIKKYSAFFKTELLDVSDQFHITGIQGPDSGKTLAQALNLDLNPAYSFQHRGDLQLITIDTERFKLITPTEQTQTTWKVLCQQASPTSQSNWLLCDIQQGIGEVTGNTAGLFVPQMLNLQARDGISFRKGCYTGQEIVARMKYLGKLKRRMYRIRLTGEALPKSGSPCFLSGKKSAQGNVVTASLSPDKQIEALLVMTEELAEQGEVCFEEGQPPQAFTIEPLPYSLEDN